MTTPTITALPTSPSRSRPSTFANEDNAFLSALPGFVSDCNALAVFVAAAAAALASPGFNATSTTSLVVGLGTQSLTVQAAKSYVPGMSLKIAYTTNPAIWMHGDVRSYDIGTGALVVEVGTLSETGGGSTYAVWTTSLSAPLVGISDTAYGAGWNADTGNAPSKNAVYDQMELRAPKASPTFTGTVAGITKAMVGLTNVDDTADASKPVSTAQQNALNLKANAANAALTGTTDIALLRLLVSAYHESSDGHWRFIFGPNAKSYYGAFTGGHEWQNFEDTPIMTLNDVGSLWVYNNMSALSFTDRTPFYEGDALAEIAKIKGKGGKVDHSSLPEFVKVESKDEKKEGERDLGAMISVLTVAVQQLLIRIEKLEGK